MHRDVKPDNIGFLDDGRTGLTMPVLLTAYTTCHLPLTTYHVPTMFLGEGRLVLFDFGLAKLWQARHIYMYIYLCVGEMYIYSFKHGSRLPFSRAYDLLTYSPTIYLAQAGPDEPADAPRQLTGQTGSARYMAPEVARSRPYGTSAEVYSFGILLWQLAAHERPFAGMDMRRHARQVAGWYLPW